MLSSALARILKRPVYAIDTRNHGESPHVKVHTYTALAEDVEAFLKKHELKNATLIGHSMGAKTVMTMALRNPDCCANIIPVDNAPVDAALSSDFPKYAEGMQHVERSQPKSQKEADKLMEPYAKDLPVRQFLLSNLVRSEPGQPLKFRIPVSILTKALDNMADFPFTNPDEASFSKRALFIRGTKSHYVSDETLPIIGRFFPRFELVDIEAGHWVISEKPEEFINGMSSNETMLGKMLTDRSCCRFLAREGVDTHTGYEPEQIYISFFKRASPHRTSSLFFNEAECSMDDCCFERATQYSQLTFSQRLLPPQSRSHRAADQQHLSDTLILTSSYTLVQ